MELMQLPVLIMIIRSDLKERQIHLYLFMLLTASIVTMAIIEEKEEQLLSNFQGSSLILLFMLSMAYTWFVFRKPGVPFIDGMIGKGDILLLLILGFQLGILSWLMVFIASLLLALLASIFLKKLQDGGIPLAASIALVYCSILLTGFTSPEDHLITIFEGLR